MAKKRSEADVPNWLLWLIERGFTGVMLLATGFLLVFAVIAAWLDTRLNSLEGRISQKPPKSYTAPDLSTYSANGFSEEAVLREASVYVPLYSQVYFGGGRPLLLEATLSIRNTSPTNPSYLRSVRYFDTDGELVSEFVDQIIALKPLQTIEFLVPHRDSSGGSGANFLVDWVQTEDSVEPLVDAVMVGSVGSQGISFRTTGVEVPAVVDDAVDN